MSILARFVLAILSLYKRVVSPLLPRHCRFEPTCSTYAAEAVRMHGARRGLYLAARRIGRCHPWNPGGIDRVPPRRPGPAARIGS